MKLRITINYKLYSTISKVLPIKWNLNYFKSKKSNMLSLNFFESLWECKKGMHNVDPDAQSKWDRGKTKKNSR